MLFFIFIFAVGLALTGYEFASRHKNIRNIFYPSDEW